MHKLEEKILQAKKEGRIALIPFLTAGFPDRKAFWQALAELDGAGADIIEIGVPFSDPVADGPVVEAASRRVLGDGVNLEEILSGLEERKGQFAAGLVLMGYLNPFLQYGFEKMAAKAAKCGVNGLIIPDLPLEESEKYKKILESNGLALIPLVGLNTDDRRMAAYARDAQGYVYIISVMGTTGVRGNLAQGVAETITRARKYFSVPIALGFGLKKPEQLEALPVAARPDAAVFGSALLTHLDSGQSARDFMDAWR